MPLFEFACDECAVEFEVLVGVHETPDCPRCGAKKVRKLMSAATARVSSGPSLTMRDACPPPEAGPCSPNCCRLPQ